MSPLVSKKSARKMFQQRKFPTNAPGGGVSDVIMSKVSSCPEEQGYIAYGSEGPLHKAKVNF